MRKEFRLPDPGEGLTDADVVTWLVAVGDTVTVNQPVVEIETAKSLVELPSPWDGTVAALLVAEGANVQVGDPILAVEVADDAATGDAGSAPVGHLDGQDRVSHLHVRALGDEERRDGPVPRGRQLDQ